MQRRTAVSAVAAVAMVAAAAVHADNYPSKTVKLVVPFAPGGTTDIIARVVTAKIQPNLGQQMIVENRAGAGGVIGANETAKATPDGYSLGMATVSTVATVPIMQLNVPYKGAGPALNDVVGGQVLILLDKLPSSLPFIKQGRLIPIVIAADKRAAALPDVPTLSEVGLPEANRVAFYGIYGPKGLPKEVVSKVHDAVKKTLEDPQVKARIEETGSTIIGNTPEQFAQQIKAEYQAYKKVAETQKLKPE